MTEKQSTLDNTKELKFFSLEFKLLHLENERRKKYSELIRNLVKYEEDIDSKKSLCKIYLYETKKIDEQIAELRLLLIRRKK